MRHLRFTRRAFLQAATSCAGAAFLDWPTSAPDLEKLFTEIRLNLLEMVNEERAVEKVRPVALDDFASQVATKHAVDMARNEFASHWGSDGLKPYHRYSLAGGTESTQENVSAADNTWSAKVGDLKQDTAYLHVRLYRETPPNDGHRKTILAPQHTHVGFGLALEKLRLRLVELFVARYLEVKPLERQVTLDADITMNARLLNSSHVLNHVEILYEPLPTPPELSWLRQPRSYGLATDSKVLLPKAPPPFKYADGSTGVVEVMPNGSFVVPVTLFKGKPGIYTVVSWIKRDRSAKAFPASEVCLKVES
jgi:uncharacterized protein YkwD